MVVVPPIIVRTLAGDECPLEGVQIPAWPETAREAARQAARQSVREAFRGSCGGNASSYEEMLAEREQQREEMLAQRQAERDDPAYDAAPALPADLNALLSAQHPGSDLADPARYELLAAAVGSTDADVPLSPLTRGEAGKAGLARLRACELDFDTVVALFEQDVLL